MRCQTGPGSVLGQESKRWGERGSVEGKEGEMQSGD